MYCFLNLLITGKKSCDPILLFSKEIVEVDESDGDDDDIGARNFTTPAVALLKTTITPDDINFSTTCVDTPSLFNPADKSI